MEECGLLVCLLILLSYTIQDHPPQGQRCQQSGRQGLPHQSFIKKLSYILAIGRWVCVELRKTNQHTRNGGAYNPNIQEAEANGSLPAAISYRSGHRTPPIPSHPGKLFLLPQTLYKACLLLTLLFLSLAEAATLLCSSQLVSCEICCAM